MNRRLFFSSIGTAFLAPFLKPFLPFLSKQPAITRPEDRPIYSYSLLDPPGHGPVTWCPVCRGPCKGHHHSIIDPGHQHICPSPCPSCTIVRYVGEQLPVGWQRWPADRNFIVKL